MKWSDRAPLRPVRVARTDALTPRMRRITLTGDALEGFATAAAGDHVTLFFPHPDGRGWHEPPAIGPDGHPVMPGGQAPIGRDYTPRRFDPATRELTIDFVLHGDGPASRWAARARPGQWLCVGLCAGLCVGGRRPGGVGGVGRVPDDYAAYLLIGDETALPSIARYLEDMPPGVPVQALIEIADAREERRLPTASDAAITWLHRDGTPAGLSTRLDQALHHLTLPSTDIHAWIGAECDVARRLEAYLRTEEAIPRHQIRAAGYWRRGIPAGG